MRKDAAPTKLHIVTKSDVGLGAPYVIGVFHAIEIAEAACVGPGSFMILTADLDRVYPRGKLLDAVAITNVTTGSLKTEP